MSQPWPALCVVALAAAIPYIWICRRISLTGGKVETGSLRWPDFFVAAFFSTLLLAAAVKGFHQGPRRIASSHDVVAGAAGEVLIVLVVVGYLALRDISLSELLGLGRRNIGSVLLYAIPLFFFAIVLTGIVKAATMNLGSGGAGAKQQEIVEFFRLSAGKSDRRALLLTMAVGVILAPLAEEFIFRGFLYPIFKKYLGIFAAVVLNSGLFALLHVNLAALLPLFVLAICFSLAYEAAGSLFVTICMHAFFNLSAFIVMLSQFSQ